MIDQALHGLRVQIAQQQVRINELRAAPPSRQEIEARLAPHLKTEEAAFRAYAGNAMIGMDVTAPLRLRVGPNGTVNLLPLMALLLGSNVLAKALLTCLDGSVSRNAPSAAEVAASLEDAESHLLGLERAEEAEVCRLESLGQQVVRRPDARPEVVLAIPDELGEPT